jgi:hypothetical protein
MTIYQQDLAQIFPALLTHHKIGWAGGRINSNYTKLQNFCKVNNLPFTEDRQAETLWRVYHNDFSDKLCVCGSQVKFDAFCRGYHRFCSTACSAINRDSNTRAGFVNAAGREKAMATIFQKYGVRHQSQISSIHEKTQSNRYKRYSVISPSGIEYFLQGYERFVVHDLWSKYGEHDVVCRKGDIPKIWYQDANGISRRYYPDFFIISENKIIEVKSTWTLKSDKGLTTYKKIGTLNSGFAYELIVCPRQ